MGYVSREVTEYEKDKTQELARYNKREVRSQRIIVESMKDSLIPFVEKLNNSKEMNDKIVNLYFVSTIGQKMSLWSKLYIMNKLKDEDMTSFLLSLQQKPSKILPTLEFWSLERIL